MAAVSCCSANDLAELTQVTLSHAYDQDQEKRHEWWCLWRLLTYTDIGSRMVFPVHIKNPDPPDFTIEYETDILALEITNATYQRYEQIARIFRANPGSILELDFSLFTNVTLKRKDGPNAWRQYVREPEAGLIGRGWQAHEPEINLAAAIRAALSRKAHGIRISNARNLLFIDAKVPLPGVCIELVTSIIEQDVNLACRRFDFVIIDFGGDRIVVNAAAHTVDIAP